MESDVEDLENIFEEYENIENDREAENVEATSNETSGVKVPAPKRIVKNPRLKFNAERLCGERGIPVLVDHFKNVKFKGVGHEKEDLDKLLTKLEHWTHRLYPSMKFEDCLHHIEKLGRKRPVQTCLRKMRLNMPILSSDFINEDEDDVHRIEDSETVDAFDRLIEESQNVLNPSVSGTENISDSISMYSPPVQSSCGIGQFLGSASGSSLTEEQKIRMERNRMLAAERRKARLTASEQNSSSQSVNEEIIPSQNISNSVEKSFDSSFRNQENIPVIACNSFTKFNHDNKLSIEEGPSELNNQNSENLGLDDLIDLVDEEDPISDKNTAALTFEEYKTVCSNTDKRDEFSRIAVGQVNSPSFDQNVNVSISGNTDSEMVTPDKISGTQNEENLGIESLLGLVNEDSEDID